MSAFRDDVRPSKHRTGEPSELHVYTVHWVNKSSSVQLIKGVVNCQNKRDNVVPRIQQWPHIHSY